MLNRLVLEMFEDTDLFFPCLSEILNNCPLPLYVYVFLRPIYAYVIYTIKLTAGKLKSW